MRDVEPELYTRIATKLRANHAGIFMTGEPVSAPSQWPCTSFRETNNYPASENMDSDNSVPVVVVEYRADVYSNKTSGRKSEAKSIISDIEEEMYALNFTFSRTPINDMGDKIAHYQGIYRAKYDGKCFHRM